MTAAEAHRILIATDGSPAAQAALATAVRFPFQDSTCVRAVVARSSWLPADLEWLTDHAKARTAFEQNSKPVADAARRVLARRWPDSKVVAVNAPPKEAILAEADRFKASMVIVGWRGYGSFRRLLAGSVSRAIATRASCPVLVVRKAPKAVRRIVIGYDGCANADRAVDLLASLKPRRGNRVTLVNVVEPTHMPLSAARLPSSIRMPIRHAMTALKRQRYQQGEQQLEAPRVRLEQAGWTVGSEVRAGDPLACLIEAVDEVGADVLALGARATSGVELALMGSVASGALDQSPCAILIAR